VKLTIKSLCSAGDKNECNLLPQPPHMWLCGLLKDDVPFTLEVIRDVTVATVYFDVTSLIRYTRQRADVSEESVGYVYTYCVNNTTL